MHWILELLSGIPTGHSRKGPLADLPLWQQILWFIAIFVLLMAVALGSVVLLN